MIRLAGVRKNILSVKLCLSNVSPFLHYKLPLFIACDLYK